MGLDSPVVVWDC